MKNWLIIYDITNPKRLSKIAKILESYGIRVQKSVFELHAERKIIEIIRKKVNKIILDDDFIVYFDICEKDWQKREKYGVQEYLDDEIESRDYYLFDL